MHISTFSESKYLKKEDVDPAILVTIRDLTEVNVALDGEPKKIKWALHFEEVDKPLIVNSTNAQLIARATGAEDTDAWPGHKIVLFKDDNVSFGGKLVGGIRVRAPKKLIPRPQLKPAVVDAEELADEFDI